MNNSYSNECLFSENIDILEVSPEISLLFEKWELSSGAICRLVNLKIISIDIFKMMHSHDIDEIFNDEQLLVDKIRFRHGLSLWRFENNLDPIICCPNFQESQYNNRKTLPLNIINESCNVPVIQSNIDIKSILINTVAGKDIIEKYNTTKYLSDTDQNAIVKIIADHFILNTIKMDPKKMVMLNLRREKNGFIGTHQMIHIMTPWKETSVKRMKEHKESIQQFLDQWPRYGDCNGHELIDIDFSTLYPGKEMIMFEKIEDLVQKVTKLFFPSSIKDKLNQQYFEKMKVASDINCKHFYFFNLLHAIILPPRISKISKPSITDAQEDMITHIFNINNYQQKVDELKELALREGLTFQPKVFVVGNSPETLKEFYVNLNNIQYKVGSVLSALDLVMKICFFRNHIRRHDVNSPLDISCISLPKTLRANELESLAKNSINNEEEDIQDDSICNVPILEQFRLIYPEVVFGGFLNLSGLSVPHEVQILLRFGPKYSPPTVPDISSYMVALERYYVGYVEHGMLLSMYDRVELESHYSLFVDAMLKHQIPSLHHRMLSHIYQVTLAFLKKHDDLIMVQADKG
ncbi:uncharacterized protein LOC119688192 [Teleopsis dalmanni]|uniref:uncharacterized protein LOC119688192 n=1 Tax=Teleopsis dalmanni TaxID=139649 RepID=UPI0018CCC27C|nr:uncharacterized protein LOC119688192 [Teleopsis dalmanni]